MPRIAAILLSTFVAGALSAIAVAAPACAGKLDDIKAPGKRIQPD